jgi:peptidoglycan hydrolase CwlO-like protein
VKTSSFRRKLYFQHEKMEERYKQRRFEHSLVTRVVEQCKQTVHAGAGTGGVHEEIEDIYAKLDRIESEQQQKQQEQDELQQQVAELQAELDGLAHTEE